MSYLNRVFIGSSENMSEIPAASVQCCVTSPPYYGLRDYGVEGQLGLEKTVEEYVDRLVVIFREVSRVLRDDGTAWLNLGDSYAGSWGAQSREEGDLYNDAGHNSQISAKSIAAHPRRRSHTGTVRAAGLKPKDLFGVPWRVAFALQADGWWLRDAIIWHKTVPMPSSVTDRCTPSYEFVFMLAKSARYYADMDAVRQAHKWAEDPRNDGERHSYAPDAKNGSRANAAVSFHPLGANLRNVWTLGPDPYADAHFAVMPRELARRCVVIGSPPGGVVLDPFMGSGTTADVAIASGRQFTGYELNPKYHELIAKRLGLFGQEVI